MTSAPILVLVESLTPLIFYRAPLEYVIYIVFKAHVYPLFTVNSKILIYSVGFCDITSLAVLGGGHSVITSTW